MSDPTRDKEAALSPASPTAPPSAAEDFASLFAESERSAPSSRGGRVGPGVGGGKNRRARYAIGDRVKGKLLSVGRDVAIVELDEGGEGTLDAVELRDESGQLTAQAGDTIEARVVAKGEKEGIVTLRRAPARGTEARASLGQFASSGLPVEGTVTGVNKGGLEVNVAGLRAFCPVSQIDLRQVADPSVYIGQKLLFRISKYDEDDRRGPNVILSRRALLEEEGRAKAAETRATLAVGTVVPGVVMALKDFGAFVDIGGLEGLLPASEIGFQRGARPADLLAVGQKITVQILRMEKREAQRRPGGAGPAEQITLSLKSLERDPWEEVVARLPAGTTVKGKVTRTEAFGAFVEILPGVEGLLHISQLGAGKHLRHAREAVQPGDTVPVTVSAIDGDKRRISLTLANDEDRIDDEGRAAVSRAGASSGMGTLGDLLRGKIGR